MNAEDVIESHPLRLLDEKTGLPKAAISLILARSGVGKSAAVINFALDMLIQGKYVIHFSAGMDSEKVHQYYKEILADFSRENPLAQNIQWDDIYSKFLVVSYPESDKMVEELGGQVKSILSSMEITPGLIVVDGLDLDDHSDANLGILNSVAESNDIRLLASMRVHRDLNGNVDLNGPLSVAKKHTDHIYFMEPAKNKILLDFISPNGKQELPVYFCPHDLIFKST